LILSFHSECVISLYEPLMGCWPHLGLCPFTVCVWSCCISLWWDADPTLDFFLPQFVCDLVVWASNGMLTPPWVLYFHSKCVVSLLTSDEMLTLSLTLSVHSWSVLSLHYCTRGSMLTWCWLCPPTACMSFNMTADINSTLAFHRKFVPSHLNLHRNTNVTFVFLTSKCAVYLILNLLIHEHFLIPFPFQQEVCHFFGWACHLNLTKVGHFSSHSKCV